MVFGARRNIEAELIEAEILELVLRIARELHPDRDVSGFGGEDSLQDKFGIDSMGRAELASRIQDSFGVRLSDSIIAKAESPSDLVKPILTYLKRSKNTSLRRAMTARQRPRAIPFGAAKPADKSTDKPDDARTVLDMLFWNAETHAERVYLEFTDPDEQTHALTFGELVESSKKLGAGLQARGLAPGEPVGIMLPTSLEFFFSFFGVLLAGGVPVPLYPPDRPAKFEDYVRRQSGILANCEARFLITVEAGKQVSHVLAPLLPRALEVFTPLELGVASNSIVIHAASANDTALIQYTSGSTGDPKGVVLSHSSLLANIRSMGAEIKANSSDVFVSWLPLYHDMGLIGACLGTLYYGAFLALISPISFLVRPSRWLRMIHDYRATLSAAPNFAYELCATKIRDEELQGLDLSAWRIAFNGAEHVSAETIRRFTRRFRGAGFRPEAMKPVYGLAESSVGLAFSPPGRRPRIERLQRSAFLVGHAVRVASSATEAEVMAMVSSGFPLPGHRIRIADSSGRALRDREIGQVQFQGPSSTSGYYRNEPATRELFRYDPWIDTGDLGFLAEGEIFIAGRTKDVLIRGGRQIYPQELEETVGNLDGVRKGCVVLFGLHSQPAGTERLIIAAETRLADEKAITRLREKIFELSASVLEVPADEVLLLPPRSLPKTSSGKLRRSECARLYEAKRLGRRTSPVRQWLRLFGTNLLIRVRRRIRRAQEGAWAVYVWGIALACGIAAMVGVAVLPRLSLRFGFARRCARAFLRLSGLQVKVTPEGHDFPRGPVVLVANHASFVDAVVLLAVLPGVFHFVAKKEFESYWLIGPLFRRIGCIFVERFAADKAVETSQLMSAAVRRGRTLLVFPEGTFRAEARLRPFYLGAFATAAETGVPVVPIAILGTRAFLRAGTLMPHQSPIEIRVFPPIVPRATGWEEKLRLRDLAREAIASGLTPSS